jgi:hypothetical protein
MPTISDCSSWICPHVLQAVLGSKEPALLCNHVVFRLKGQMSGKRNLSGVGRGAFAAGPQVAFVSGGTQITASTCGRITEAYESTTRPSR